MTNDSCSRSRIFPSWSNRAPHPAISILFQSFQGRDLKRQNRPSYPPGFFRSCRARTYSTSCDAEATGDVLFCVDVLMPLPCWMERVCMLSVFSAAHFPFTVLLNSASAGPLLPRMQATYHVGYTIVSLIFISNCIVCSILHDDYPRLIVMLARVSCQPLSLIFGLRTNLGSEKQAAYP